MRIVTFSTASNPAARFGAQLGAHIVDLPAAYSLWTRAGNRSEGLLPTDALSFVQAGAAAQAIANDVLRFAEQNLDMLAQEGAAYSAEAIIYHAPIPNPQKIICVGANYTAHIIEMGRELPKYPMLFAKYNNVLTGHRQNVPMPKVSPQVDYEAELALVIGKRAKDVKAADAFAYIAGYMPFNDITVRDYQNRTSQWLMGKTFDGCGPCGPAMVTADEVGNPEALAIKLRLNGEEMQNSNTGDLFFKIPVLIETLSEVMTLEPGDIISTGTPGGVGMARNPQVFMKPGDVVEVEIEGLGVLQNTIV